MPVDISAKILFLLILCVKLCLNPHVVTGGAVGRVVAITGTSASPSHIPGGVVAWRAPIHFVHYAKRALSVKKLRLEAPWKRSLRAKSMIPNPI